MKIAAISDTHGTPFTVPPCDVFVHAGDMTSRGTFPEHLRFMGMLPRGCSTVIVPGNHDRLFAERIELVPAGGATVRDAGSTPLPWSAHVLIDQAVELNGRVFYGSPWTLPFNNWHFMATEQELAQLYRKMPAKVDVLVTHGPAYGACDGVELGSRALAEAIAARRIGLHLFGHIHESGGETMGIHSNVSALDLQYQVRRGCTEFEVGGVQ